MRRPIVAGPLRLALALAGAVLALAVVPLPASAHNTLVSTNPVDGAVLATTPSQVILTFDEPAIAMGTELVVTGPSGAVQNGTPELVDRTVVQPIRSGAPAGSYVVEWRVTSADGHPITGRFAFTSRSAGTGTPQPADTPAPTVPVALPGVSSVVVGLVVGVALVALVIIAVSTIRRRPRTPATPPTESQP